MAQHAVTQGMVTGGQALVAGLQAAGVDTVFCVPGESYLAALDALIGSNIRVITCRHEGGAAFMAEAYGKLTGKTGVCFVTRGPGACNASIGLHTAKQDSTPFLLLIGQVARADRGREAFQEIDYRQMFAPPIAKAVYEAEDATTLAQLTADAVALAEHGRRGPVAISLPEDVLTDMTPAVAVTPQAPAAANGHDALAQQLPALIAQQLPALIAQAQAPVILLGGSDWDSDAIAQVEGFATRHHLPVVTAFRRQDLFDNNHDCYAGALGTTVDTQLLAAVRDSDLVIALGTRIGDIMTQGYTLFDMPRMKQKILHAYPDAAELNRNYTADVAVHAGMRDCARVLATLDIADCHRFYDRTRALHDRYMQWSAPRGEMRFDPDLDGIMNMLIASMPRDTIITTDAGNFSGWAQRYWRYARPNRLLAPTSGAMGYGVPSAIAASLVYPDVPVVGFMGDGGFMMTAQDIATAQQHGASPILLVFDNGMYGTIRMHQEKHYPGRVNATTLENPDFAAFAQSFGAYGARVETTGQFTTALEEALEATQRDRRVAVIHICMDPEQLTTGATLSAIRHAAEQEKKS